MDAMTHHDRGAPGTAAADRIVVVIPTLNEEQSIGDVVRRIPRHVVSRIIVADGGSTMPPRRGPGMPARTSSMPGAATAGRAWRRPWPPRTPISSCSWMATAPTIRRPSPTSSSRSAPGATISSSARAPAAIASPEASPGTSSRPAGWPDWACGCSTARATRICARFRAIRRDALLDLGMRELTYGWNIEMQMRAARAGLRILEIPVDYRRRSGGNSKVAGSLTGTIRAGARIMATFLRVSAQSDR